MSELVATLKKADVLITVARGATPVDLFITAETSEACGVIFTLGPVPRRISELLISSGIPDN